MKGDFGKNGIFVDGAIYTCLSPFETKPFKGFFANSIPNRLNQWSRISYWGPWLFFGGAYYGIYLWSLKANALSKRKNPMDFENDI